MAVANIGFNDTDFNEYTWYAPLMETSRSRIVDQPKRLVHFEHDDQYYWAWIVNIVEAEVLKTEKFRDPQTLLKAYNWIDEWGMSNLMRVDYMKLIMDNKDRTPNCIE